MMLPNRNCTLALVVMSLGTISAATPADATLYCVLKKTPDGFVALRAGPSPSARIVLKMHPGDTVLIQNAPGAAVNPQWDQVLHWRKEVYEKLRKLGQEDSSLGTRGWVNKRFYLEDSCG